MATPRLRALLTLYAAVAAASAMVIVNTVVFIRENMGLEDTDVALAFAAAGLGSMIAALLVPKALEFVNDRTLMIGGSVCMGGGLVANGDGSAIRAVVADVVFLSGWVCHWFKHPRVAS